VRSHNRSVSASPALSSFKMLISENQTSDALAAKIGRGSETDMLEIVGTAALEYIGQGGLGHSFAENKTDALHDMKELL
jgi:hypothetical protein